MKYFKTIKILVMASVLTSLLFQLGCISFKKRPKRLFREVVQQQQQFDAIIVPGVPFKNNAWDSTMKSRVIWSYVLYKHGYAKNIIYSGGAVYSSYYEAKIMGLYAQQMGVPSEHIFYDTLAEHSTENVFYSYELARKLGFKSIALATDPFQSSLLKFFTRKRFGTKVYHLPFVVDSLQAYNNVNPIIDPSSAICADSFVSITQRENFWNRIKGTLGKNIPWKNKETRKAEKL
jgi:uncharacterized SAM-binding protein YcdF (DUF218 family)